MVGCLPHSTLLTWFLFLQTEEVDVKHDQCKAFPTEQTASHLTRQNRKLF